MNEICNTADLYTVLRKYHPQEHDLFDAVDGEYKQRLEMALGITGVT